MIRIAFSIPNKFLLIVQFFKNALGFLIFFFGMQKLSIQLWVKKLRFQTAPLAHIIVVYFDPEKIKDPYSISLEIEKTIGAPFEKLHGFPPIVFMIPEGLAIETGFFDDFVRCLNARQRKEFKNALYRVRDIELVSV
ncbi:hypothetical protein [Leptospira sp. id769339]|uniref:hypothetical protein n=1 Tax=Leptospira sp. id769339 TaxID=2864221 RepID=UPI00214B55B3|nr:hypothetical protein [Leptospira sp. id769339]MCR1794889.1 hypothetical protein [Leptospira sp. id769339]